MADPKKPKVTIIIPLYDICPRFFKDFKKYDRLNYPDYEIIVVSDTDVQLPKLKQNCARLVLTGLSRTGPAEKRDIAIKKAKGKICAFIDDDAYPDKDWLKNSVVHFQHPKIAAVGGPGLTPKSDSYWAKLTGFVYSSFFCGGHAQHRFVKGKIQFVDDYPAYNLLVRKKILEKVGGYGSYFYGGEDTFLCLKIVNEGYKIIYDSEAVVYHHRRRLFIPYLRQIANIGKHRGYFAKKYPETSRKLIYLIPTLLSFGFIFLSIASFYSHLFLWSFIFMLIGFYVIGVLSLIKKTNIINALISSLAIILTHLVYGLNFVGGVLTKKIIR